jgi:hypothetical protein
MLRECGGKSETEKRAKPAPIHSRTGSVPPGSLIFNSPITKTLSPLTEVPSTLFRYLPHPKFLSLFKPINFYDIVLFLEEAAAACFCFDK